MSSKVASGLQGRVAAAIMPRIAGLATPAGPVTTMKNHALSLSLALLMPLLGACPGSSSETQGTGDSEGSSTGDDSTSTSGNTETSSTSGGSGSASEGSSTTDDGTGTSGTSGTSGTTGTTGTTGTSGTTDGTTTGGSDAVEESCKAACGLVVECDPDFGTLEECLMICIENTTPPEPDAACEKAGIALNECIASATCKDLNDPDFCLAEENAVGAACGGGGECSSSAGANMEGTECQVTEECPGDYVHDFQCTAKSCTCIEDGNVTMECPTKMNFCANFDANLLEQFSFECCGW